ncbi:thioredoxin-like protein [Filobasidium floriforme]|uniref:thioredoxin-like protein n=1 Tax=Filobasidium floriforme TaxID=5210 RepID=UPI001E8D2AC5|nr:thioredoxin-like protein [Filobasidium floriforme]KAH8089367.1 thioredoxin-like protein [Filobasidium floriforme]
MSSSNLLTIDSPEQFKDVLSRDLNKVSVLDFWATWAQPCEKMNEVVKEASEKYKDVLFLMIEADVQDEIADSFDIEEVPTFLILRGHTLLARHAGSNAPLLLQLIEQHSSSSNSIPTPLSSTTKSPIAPPTSVPDASSTSNSNSIPPYGTETDEQLEARCTTLMNRHKVVLFMKGNPSAPKCGFSRQIVGLLRERGVEFAWYDILSDQAVREGLKKMNDWPTFPQVILNGELIGGLDIFKDSLESGEWDEMYNSTD